MGVSIYDISGNKVNLNEILTVTNWGLPKIYITCDKAYSELTKDKKSKGTLKYIDGKTKFSCPIDVKLQGNYSINYAKRNLNITFYEDDRSAKRKIAFGGWYPTNKIHMKANLYDYSMVRNSVASRIAHDFMGTNLPNGCSGYIDSFPCILYYNDEFKGCYTWNLPQDGKTYNFDDDDELACKNLAFRTVSLGTYTDLSDWEYRGDEDATNDMNTVFGNLLTVISDDANLTEAKVEQHFDVPSLLGYIVFAQIGWCSDSLVNNWTLITWDGEKWYHTFYDLDICFGLPHGERQASTDGDILTGAQNLNAFMSKVNTLYTNEIKELYANWRKHGFEADAIAKRFTDFQNVWGWQNIHDDKTLWSEQQETTATSDADKIKSWLTARLAYLDTVYNYS